jgi:hypothetical protein
MKGEVIIPVHHPNHELLHEVVATIQTPAEWSIRIIDSNTFWIGDTFDHCSVAHDYPVKEWPKVKAVYDESTADLVAICHQDDFWLKDKLNHQLRYIQQSPLCMTSFIYSYKDRTMPHQRAMREIAVPAIDSEIGLWNCMPSTWVLNKSKLPTLPIPYNNGSTMCMDQAIAMAISQMGPIEVVRMPFVIYNDLGLNQWHSASKEEHLKARHDLKSFFHSIPRPQLNYHWS